MNECLILTGGPMDLSFAGSCLKGKQFSRIIAVDAGMEAALALGLTPDIIVGDFDTVSPAALAHFRAQEHIVWDVHRPEKDETDTELALRRALALGCERALMLGATGGRLDHLIGNIHLLYPCLQKGMETVILDPQNRVYLIDGPRTFRREELWGTYLSFLPLTETVKGLTLRGFRYPLTDREISIGTSLCISNELTGEEGTLDLREGVLIVVESRD